MKRENLISYLDRELREITDRIKELETKESDGTIITSENNPNEKELDELNELYILKSYYDVKLYKGIIDRIYDGQFSSINDLRVYLNKEIAKADKSVYESNLYQNAEIEVQKLSQQQFTDITTLDRILFEVEKLIEG